jgi:hypothetical protein
MSSPSPLSWFVELFRVPVPVPVPVRLPVPVALQTPSGTRKEFELALADRNEEGRK